MSLEGTFRPINVCSLAGQKATLTEVVQFSRDRTFRTVQATQSLWHRASPNKQSGSGQPPWRMNARTESISERFGLVHCGL